MSAASKRHATTGKLQRRLTRAPLIASGIDMAAGAATLSCKHVQRPGVWRGGRQAAREAAAAAAAHCRPQPAQGLSAHRSPASCDFSKVFDLAARLSALGRASAASSHSSHAIEHCKSRVIHLRTSRGRPSGVTSGSLQAAGGQGGGSGERGRGAHCWSCSLCGKPVDKLPCTASP